MLNTLFIADLHLSESRPDITAAFVHFVETQAIHADALYVLGDLFEVWVGDDEDAPLHRQVMQCFKHLTDSKVPVFFIHGNRDFLIGKRFSQRTGVQILPEHSLIDLYGKTALIMHGDTLCTADIDYQKFRRQSRSWWWQTAVLCLPLKIRQHMGAKARQKSQQINQYKSEEIMDVTQAEVIQQMQAFGVNLLIHGHTHRPAIHQFGINGEDVQRVVLGDWYEQGSVLTVSADNMQLTHSPLAIEG
ncbi:UDP-2,3-diacylglucosamine diphosphatase [Alteromonadaceae bacterium BrNp21-10]|nr:UDP-2,3-diacylglucosamine diphosphatase [Alteromonadaceae bacterium BrNp21-10]